MLNQKQISMKTKFTLLFLVLTFICTAQTSLKFVSGNKGDMRTLADSIVLNAKHTFKYAKEGQIKESSVYFFKYVNITDTTNVLALYYNIKMKGENVALEVTGTPEYTFYAAKGKFLDLFPFWKRYINRNADIAKISTSQDDKTINGSQFYLQEDSGQWKLSMH